MFKFVPAYSVLVANHPVAAEHFPGSIPAENSEAATQVLAVMEAVKQSDLEIGQFVPVGNSNANGGPGLRLELIQALESKRPGVVKDRALLAVGGKFLAIADPQDARKQLQAEKLTLEIIDKTTGDTIKPITVFIRRLRDIATIEGLTGPINPDAPDARTQHQDLRRRMNNPEAFLDGTRLLSQKDSPFAIELATAPKPASDSDPVQVKPRKVSVNKGEAFVPIDKGEVYEVLFHNGASHEVAISLKVDGIDMFTFSDDRDEKTKQPRFNYFIVPPRKTLSIPGWFKTIDRKRTDNFQRFLVTDYGKGAAGKFPTRSQGQVGVITVLVSRSHLPGSGRAKSSEETGFGPPVEAKLKPVERLIDPPHDFITVRYLR